MTLEYLNEKMDSPSWQRNCRGAVKSFLDSVYGTTRGNPSGKTTTVDESALYENLATQYIAEKRDNVRDIINWKKTSKMAAKTLKVYLSGVREFMEVNGVEFTKEGNKKIKQAFKGGEEAPVDAPDHHQIRSFLEHCDVRLKAITLMLSSSGMRIGECLSITEKSLDYDRRMITLKAAQTKTKTGRTVFFSKEAERALNNWMKARTSYIQTNNAMVEKLGTGRGTKMDERIFPYDSISINRAWNKAAKKAGFDQRNDVGFMVFHLHSLRKFFSTQLRNNRCPDSVVETLLGHKMYLNMYTSYTPIMLEEKYAEYSDCLKIGSADDVRKTVSAIAEKALETNGVIESLKKENAALVERLNSVERIQSEEVQSEEQRLFREFLKYKASIEKK